MMSPELIGVIVIGCLFLLLLLGVNIAVALASIGTIGVMMLTNANAGLDMLSVLPYVTVSKFEFSCLPLFILMGELAFTSGITTKVFDSAFKWVGSFPGGMAMAVMIAAAGFGAVSGSTIVAAAAMTRVCWPELMKYKYDKGFSAGVLVSAGCLSIMIPPSIIVVFYGMLTQTPIGPTLIACVIPGLITTILYLAVIYIRARINPSLAPRGYKASWKEKISSLSGTWSMLILVFLVTGGLYFGLFTATEAAAAGAFGALILAALYKKLTWSVLAASLISTARICAFIFLIMIGAALFSKVLALSNLSTDVVEFVGNLKISRIYILLAMIGIYVVLGMLLDTISMLAISLSTVFPIITALGYDPVWFGVVIITMCELATVTPPVGLNVFAVKTMLGNEVEVWDIFKNSAPFYLAHFTLLLLLILFPQICLWLPATIIK